MAAILSLAGAAALAAVLLGGGGSPQTASPVPSPQSLLSAGPHDSSPAVVPQPDQPASHSESPPLAESPPFQAVEEGALPAGAASPPLHISYAAVGMDQVILPLSPTDEEMRSSAIVPPNTADAYWLAPYGVPGAGSTNTTYIVGHSWEGRPSPFNEVSSRARPGDQLTVTTVEGPLIFVIDQISTEYKDTLKDSAIWDKVPGRLVLITCYTEDLWGKNIIAQASPAPAG